MCVCMYVWYGAVCVFYMGGGTVEDRCKKSLLCVMIRNIHHIVRKMILLIKQAGRKRLSLVGFKNLLPQSPCLSLGSAQICSYSQKTD